MAIRIEDLTPGDPGQATPTGVVQVILKVRKAGYVPPAVKLRARIDEHIFTADVPAEELSQLERNPEVVSVAANRKLQIIE
jgi:hypothetical protein